MSWNLIQEVYTIQDLKDFIKVDYKDLNKSTINGIKNAWIESVILDKNGKVWVKVDKIYILLRTDVATAKYLVQKISDGERISYQNSDFIPGYYFFSLIDEYLQQATDGKKREYMRFSQNFYLAIRDSERADLLRHKYSEMMTKKRKDLKNQRIILFNIQYDELTNQPLDKKNAEFSHIRAYSLFPNIGLEISNGLIVHKDIHSLITQRGIMDEDELLRLCHENQWSTNWYNTYLSFLQV